MISPITRYGAKLAYNTIYTPAVRYALPQSFFDETVLDKAQVKSMKQIKQKCGYALTTPDTVIYAPKAYAGAGFIPWKIMQGEGQIVNFIKHWRTDTLFSDTL